MQIYLQKDDFKPFSLEVDADLSLAMFRIRKKASKSYCISSRKLENYFTSTTRVLSFYGKNVSSSLRTAECESTLAQRLF
jgi:hypothetical protein